MRAGESLTITRREHLRCALHAIGDVCTIGSWIRGHYTRRFVPEPALEALGLNGERGSLALNYMRNQEAAD